MGYNFILCIKIDQFTFWWLYNLHKTLSNPVNCHEQKNALGFIPLEFQLNFK